MSTNKHIHFPGLNTLRCIAAFVVIFHHIEMFKYHENMASLWQLPAVVAIGKMGVILFFVLSGFLITYLLLEEKSRHNDINVKKFYMRRILRIWPVYYLLFGITIFLLVNNFSLLDTSSWDGWVVWGNLNIKDLLYLVFFLPNVFVITPGSIPFFSISWSVGVEEQFYLIWPVLLKLFKNTLKLLISVILIYLFIKIPLFSILKYRLHANPSALAFFKSFWANFNIDSMAIGGIFSYLFFTKHKALKFFFLKSVQLTTIIILLVGLATGFHLPFINNELYSVFFGIFIVNTATNPSTIVNLENKLGNFLGKISYGLYMYLSLCIVLCIKLMKYFHLDGSGLLMDNLIVYASSISLSIIVSALSYQYFERFFLKIKEKMAVVKSSGESGGVTS